MQISPYAAYAFDSLYSDLLGKKAFSLAQWEQLIPVSDTGTSSPLFVTWNLLVNNDRELRGCIGNFGSLDLESGIKEYALIAAYEDTRFNPIAASELQSLECDVTLLQHFEDADSPLDWELGKHGIRIHFTAGGRPRSATFLPDVAIEQGWDKQQTLNHLVYKAGVRASWENLDIKLTRYEGIKTGVTYDEYLSLRKKLEK